MLCMFLGLIVMFFLPFWVGSRDVVVSRVLFFFVLSCIFLGIERILKVFYVFREVGRIVIFIREKPTFMFLK